MEIWRDYLRHKAIWLSCCNDKEQTKGGCWLNRFFGSNNSSTSDLFSLVWRPPLSSSCLVVCPFGCDLVHASILLKPIISALSSESRNEFGNRMKLVIKKATCSKIILINWHRVNAKIDSKCCVQWPRRCLYNDTVVKPVWQFWRKILC